MKNKKAQEFPFEILIWVVVVFVIILTLFLAVYTIPAGYGGVVLTFGKPSAVATDAGIHLKIPFAQSIIKMDTRTTKYEADLTAASSDLQDVNTKIAINYHIALDNVPEIYRTIGVNYADKVIYPLEQESNKAATAKFTAVELITKREQVRTEMENILREKLAPRGIVVESISIVNFAFSPSFAAAIENKVTQEQNALAEQNKLEAIKFQAEQRVAQAQGEADAIAIQAKAINSAGGKDYVQLQAIARWNGQTPIVMLGGGSTPFIDISSFTTTK